MYIAMQMKGMALGVGAGKLVCRAFELSTGQFFAFSKPRSLFSGVELEEQVEALREVAFKQSWRESEFLRRLEGASGVIQMKERMIFREGKTDQLLMIREVYEDGTLEEYLTKVMEGKEKKVQFSPSEEREIARQMLEGLLHIHEAGIIHRDIKPDNILIDRRGVLAALSDFDIACFAEEETALGQNAFVPLFCAPELAKVIDLTHREYNPKVAAACTFKVDVWAMGGVLYELFFLERLPWDHPGREENEVEKVLARIAELHEGWIPSRHYGHPFFPLIREMMRIDPKERLSSQEVVERFQQA